MEARLADPAIYLDASKKALEDVLRDQAYVGKELGELEGEWLDKQAELEQPAG
jgi:ATP-binding cassette subfamily F protein 3